MAKKEVARKSARKIHPDHVPGFLGTNDEHGAAIGRMRYDQVAEVLEGLRREVLRQSEEAIKRKCYPLHGHLLITSGDIAKLVEQFQKIFFQATYMEQELHAKKRIKK